MIEPTSSALRLREALERLAEANHRALELLRGALEQCLGTLRHARRDVAEYLGANLP
jgi:hypothetical protein